MSQLTASASYFLAAIAAEGDTELVEETYRAVAALLPYHLVADLNEAWEGIA